MSIDSFLAALRSESRVELHTLVALRRGEQVVEAYWAPWTATDRVQVYSASKTVTGAAVGIAIGEGLLGLDNRVVDLLEPGREVDPRVAEITVHHLLSMSTGHITDLDLPEGVDPVEAFFTIVPEQPVGSIHAYNNLASWMLGELVRRRSGESLMEYLRPRLFEPLGIQPTWDTDEFGRELGLAGLHVTTRDLARVGELFRLGGTWQGRQLIPAEYIAQAGRLQIPTSPDAEREWTNGYGYQVWLSREGYRLDGAYGQYCLVLPERELVIAFTSCQAPGSQLLLNLVFDHLVPAVEAGQTMRAPIGLQVTPAADAGGAGPWACDQPAIAPEEGPAHLQQVRVARSGDGWRLAAEVDGDPIQLTVDGTGWHRTTIRVDGLDVPVAVSIGTDEEGARVLLAFTDTIHVLEVRVTDGAGRQFWRGIPLGFPRISELIAR